MTLDRWGHNIDDIINDVSQNLVDLEVLHLGFEESFFRSKTILWSLVSLRKLKKFSLRNSNTKANLQAILEMFSYLQPNSTQLDLSINLFYGYDYVNERDITDPPTVIRLPHLQHFKLYGYELTEEKFMEIIEMAPALCIFDLDCQSIALNIEESFLLQIVNIRKRQAQLNGTPVVRLTLILRGFGECGENKRFQMSKIIRKWGKKIRRTQCELFTDDVLLPFYENAVSLPYSEEIAKYISIEVHYNGDFGLYTD